MAGHSKWNNIKHRKAAQDKRRSKAFTRILREITSAVKSGGADAVSNSTLRLCIQNAKSVGIPKETIERVVLKASGNAKDEVVLVNYECYGAGGVAIFVEAATSNVNRTIANVRAMLSKHGGSLGTKGSLGFVFEQKGIFEVKQNENHINREELELECIDAGAEELNWSEDNIIFIVVLKENFGSMQKKIEELKLDIIQASLERVPLQYKTCDLDNAKRVIKLLNKLEDDEDIENVYHNMEMTDEILNIWE